MFARRKTAKVLFIIVALLVSGIGCRSARAPETEQVLRYNLVVEPETLDPAKMVRTECFTVITQLLEGLTRIGMDGRPVPGIAERWEQSPDGKKYIFHLRDAKWSNGASVTAYDFEYAWKRALDPKTASEYCYQLYYIKNAARFNKGEVSGDKVGVRAVDEKRLEVELESPTPYFLSLVAFPTYMPLPKSVVESSPRWWAEASTTVANGPFKMVEWRHNDRMTLVRNEDYWDSRSVKLKKLVFYMIGDANTELAMFERGELDYAENPPLPEIGRLKKEGKLRAVPQLGTYFYLFNVKKPPLDDVRVRKALAYAVNRKAITDNILKGGRVPAMALVPPGVPDAGPGTDFRKTGGDLFKDGDVAEARRLLSEAGYPEGKGFPKIELMFDAVSGHKAIAEAVSQMWKKELGIKDVGLVSQESQVLGQNVDQGKYMIARGCWIGDYNDPMTFLDMWTTGGGNNDTFWSNPEYDALVEKAKSTNEANERFRLMHQLEKMLMDEMPILPIYYYVELYLLKDYVKDVYVNPLGPVDFKHAWISRH